MIKQGTATQDREASTPEGGWFAQQRLAFIESRLFWSGRVNRSDLTETFNIHRSVASGDLTDYQRLAPRNALYDKSEKTYKAGPRFIPVVTAPSLANLLGHALLNDSFLAGRALFEIVPMPQRAADPVVVRNVIEAATESARIKAFYRSMSHPEGRWRWIEPHSIIFDGLRWHCRAFCHLRGGFRDFNLSRILKVSEFLTVTLDERDDAWERTVDISIRPHRNLTSAQAEMIADEYGMRDGLLTIPCREALLSYLLINLGLDRELQPPRQGLELVDPTLRAWAR